MVLPAGLFSISHTELISVNNYEEYKQLDGISEGKISQIRCKYQHFCFCYTP